MVDEVIPNDTYNIYNVIINGNIVYLYYDITITEDALNKQKQLDINLSEIKDNISADQTQIDNKTIYNYYDEGCEIYVLLTYHIQNIKAERDVDGTNTTELFKILYKFTKFNFSIVTNETIQFYIDKSFKDIELSNLTVLKIKLNYIQDNSNSGDSTGSDDKQDEQQESNQQEFCLIEAWVEKQEDTTQTGNDNNDYYIVEFIGEEQPIPKYDTSNDNNNTGFVREPVTGFVREPVTGFVREPPTNDNKPSNPTPEETIPEYNTTTYNNYINPKSFEIIKLYKKVIYSNIMVKSSKEIRKYKSNIIKYDNVEYTKNSLYNHIEYFISKMNNENVYKSLISIVGSLNGDKKNKLKKLFFDNGLNPNYYSDYNDYSLKSKLELLDSYGHFYIDQWNYYREYTALKYFYKQNKNNTKGINPLKEVIDLMCTNYAQIVIYSHTKSIYDL